MRGENAKKNTATHGKRPASRHTSPNTAEKGATRPSNGSTPKKPRKPAPKTSGPAGAKKPPTSATGLSLEERLLAYLAEHGRAMFGAELFKSLHASRDELMAYLAEQKELRANGGSPAIALADGVITLARTTELGLHELVARLGKSDEFVSDADLAKGLGTKVKAVRDVVFSPAGRVCVEARPGEKGAWLFKLKRGGAVFIPVAQTDTSTKQFLDGVLAAKTQKTLKARLVTGAQCAELGISDLPTGGIALTAGKRTFVVAIDADNDYRTYAPTGAEAVFVPSGFAKHRAAATRDPLIIVDDVLDALALEAQGLAAVAIHASCKTGEDIPEAHRAVLGDPAVLLGPWPGDITAQAVRMTEVAVLLEKSFKAAVSWTLGPDAGTTRVARLVRGGIKALREVLAKTTLADPVERLKATDKDRRILLVKDVAFMTSIVERDARIEARPLFRGQGVKEFDRAVQAHERKRRTADDPKRAQELLVTLGASHIGVHTSEPPVVLVTSSATGRVVKFESTEARRSFLDYDHVCTQMALAALGKVAPLLDVSKEGWREAACLLMASAEQIEAPEDSYESRRLRVAVRNAILDMAQVRLADGFGAVTAIDARAELQALLTKGRCIGLEDRRAFFVDGVAHRLRVLPGDFRKTSHDAIILVLKGLGCERKIDGTWIPIPGLLPTLGLSLRDVWQVSTDALLRDDDDGPDDDMSNDEDPS